MTPDSVALGGSAHEVVAVLGLSFVVAGLPAIEYALARWLGREVYDGADTVSSLLQSVGHLVVGTVLRVAMVLVYCALASLVPWNLDASSPVTWVVGLLVLDLAYWARHFAMHRISLLWAVHVIHHESNHYNLSSGQRIGWFVDVFALPFLLPAALTGLPISVVAAILAFSQIYTLLTHTALVDTVPFVEGILITPRAHRVHHGCNVAYIDTNYGGILAIWDRLFGTWVELGEAPVYGTTTPIDSWDPLANNLRPLTALARRAVSRRSFGDALRVVFAPPRWEPGRGERAPAAPMARVDPQGQAGLAAILGLAPITVAASLVAVSGPQWDGLLLGAGVVVVLGSAIAVGRLLTVRLDPVGFVRRTWQEVDREATGAEPGTANLVAISMVAGGAVLLASRFADPAFAASLVPTLASDPSGRAIAWALGVGLSFGVLPVAYVVWTGTPPSELGLGFGHVARDAKLYLGVYMVCLPALFFGAGRADIAGIYPLCPAVRDGLLPLAGWLAAYAVMFTGLEALFRGVLLFPLARRIGSAAVTVGVVPYVLVHALWHKGVAETAMSIPFAVLAATLALRSNSILGVLALHVGIAATTDLLVLARDGTLARLLAGVL